MERNRDVLAINPAGLGKSLAKSGNHGGARLGRAAMQIADEREPWLLRSRHHRPNCRAAEQRDDLAPPHHSITSSAMASNDGGTVRPSIRAVWLLITRSNLDDCTTGRSMGFAPLRIRP